MDFSNHPLPRANLTFEVVDDLVGAHARGRLNGAPQVRYAATDMCPLIELMMEASNGRTGPLLQTPWLDSITQLDLRAALASNQNIWLDETRRYGFMRMRIPTKSPRRTDMKSPVDSETMSPTFPI